MIWRAARIIDAALLSHENIAYVISIQVRPRSHIPTVPEQAGYLRRDCPSLDSRLFASPKARRNRNGHFVGRHHDRSGRLALRPQGHVEPRIVWGGDLSSLADIIKRHGVAFTVLARDKQPTRGRRVLHDEAPIRPRSWGTMCAHDGRSPLPLYRRVPRSGSVVHFWTRTGRHGRVPGHRRAFLNQADREALEYASRPWWPRERPCQD